MKNSPIFTILSILACYLLPTQSAFAAATESSPLDLTFHSVGYLCLLVFVIAYVLVIMEEKTQLRKSKPIMVAAGIIWIIIAIGYAGNGDPHQVEDAIRHNFLEFAELFFFLLVAMTYINAMLDRGVFEALKHWLVKMGFSFRALFWITGVLAFCISPIADNLTTALIMCAVVMTVGKGSPQFISIACVNIVVASNAGGAFSPFGDITTLMVWRSGILEFSTFFKLIGPSIVNFVIPAMIMQMYLPKGSSDIENLTDDIPLKKGGLPIVALFILTIVTAVCFHNYLNIPPVFGMMMGLGYLKIYGYYLHQFGLSKYDPATTPGSESQDEFDIFKRIAHAEWDTLLFFYGVILAVGGLGFIGYLELTSSFFYDELGATTANILVGILSALVDNIPVMFAVLTMNPDMGETQWLLATLTAGVGGSLLSIGSAAGVALMGQARGQYTFFSHLKWTPVISLGYIASIYVHLLIN